MAAQVQRMPTAWRQLAARRAESTAVVRHLRTAVQAGAPVEPTASADVAGLRYVSDVKTPGIRRLGRPGQFRYVSPFNRTAIRNEAVLQRIRSLAIPPAWTDVWICPTATGHIQATGRDARGRKQYRYHARWREVRDGVKFARLLAFARALPRIRARTSRAVARPGLPREKVLATVVQLLERTLIRVGNEDYARSNGSIGLTTMRDGHAKIAGARVQFIFRGKSGIQHAIDIEDRRLARIVKACRDLPGYELFQYLDRSGRRQTIDSGEVNAYIREVSGADFTAKDFRTWAGTVLAARALAQMEPAASPGASKRRINQAIEEVAARLGNTRAVCRTSYIHPAILTAYAGGRTIGVTAPPGAGSPKPHHLSREEAAVVAMVEEEMRRTPLI
jgi:DNA topoisomerase-1